MPNFASFVGTRSSLFLQLDMVTVYILVADEEGNPHSFSIQQTFVPDFTVSRNKY